MKCYQDQKLGNLLCSLRYFSDIIEVEKSNKKKKVPQKYKVHSLTSITKEVMEFFPKF